MKKSTIVAILIIALAVGGLLTATKARAPIAPPQNTRENWADKGVPVDTGVITRGNMERTVEVTGDINALNKVTLSSKIQGRVAEVFAREGDPVTPGMTVIRLDQQDALANLQQAQASLASAATRLSQAKTNLKVTDIQSGAAIAQAEANLRAVQAKLAVVRKPARSQEQMVAENSVASAKANLDLAESNYKRYKQLKDEGAISSAQFDTYESTYKVAQSQFKSASEQLSMIKEGGRAEDIHGAQAQVQVAIESLRQAKANAANSLLRKEDIKAANAALQQAQAGLTLARQQLSYTYIKSPIAGQLATRTVDPGQVVAPGQALADVVGLSSLYFKGDVSEIELTDVAKGQQVNVQIDAMPGQILTGTVDEIFPSGSIQNRNFPVRIGIKSAEAKVRPGMFARGKIVTGVDKDVLLVPKDAVEERHGTKLVFTIESRMDKTPPAKPGEKTAKSGVKATFAKRHDIVVLRENRDYAEVQTPVDLNAGDIVVTMGRGNLQEGTKISVSKGK